MRNFAQDRIRAAARVASRTIILFLPALLGLAMPGAYAQDDEFGGRDSLRSITSMCVLVERPDGAAAAADWTALGLTADSLRTIVELKLRQNGIGVIAKADAHVKDSCIYLNTNALGRSAHISLSVLQTVLLYRDQSIGGIPGVSTWSVANILTNTTGAHVRDAVGTMMDQFLNAWLAANPKDGAK